MPRTDGVYTPPAGTKGVPDATIRSAPYNALVDDLTADANNARPITAGGTGATNATDARENIGALASDDVLSALLKDSPVDADGIVVTDSEDTGKLKRVLWSKVKAVVNLSSVGATVAAANGKETPEDGDFFAGVAAGGSTMFKTTWGNIKTALQALFYTKAASDALLNAKQDKSNAVTTNTVQNITATKRILFGANIGNNMEGGLEIRPDSGVETDTFLSFHIPAVSRRVNVGLRPGGDTVDAFGIGGGSLGGVFYNFWNSAHFTRTTDANIIIAGGADWRLYRADALRTAILSLSLAHYKNYANGLNDSVGATVYGRDTGKPGNVGIGTRIPGSRLNVAKANGGGWADGGVVFGGTWVSLTGENAGSSDRGCWKKVID